MSLLAQAEKLPEDPGKSVVLKVCNGCHAPEAVLGTNNTKQGWTELVDEMIDKGAKADAKQRREIIRYLVRHFPMRPR